VTIGRHIDRIFFLPLLGRIWILTSRVSVHILCAWKTIRTAPARIILTQGRLRTTSIVRVLPRKLRSTVGGIRERHANGKKKEDQRMHLHWWYSWNFFKRGMVGLVYECALYSRTCGLAETVHRTRGWIFDHENVWNKSCKSEDRGYQLTHHLTPYISPFQMNSIHESCITHSIFRHVMYDTSMGSPKSLFHDSSISCCTEVLRGRSVTTHYMWNYIPILRNIRDILFVLKPYSQKEKSFIHRY
jgi:hypothetical protein